MDLAGPFPILQFFMGVFDHYDRSIHHSADGYSDAAKTHDVRANPQVVHADERDEDRYRQCQNHHEGAWEMKEEYHADDAHGYPQLNHLIPEGFHRAVNQFRSIVGRDDLDPFRERRFDFINLRFHPVDYIEHIFAETHNDDAAHALAFAVQVRRAAPYLRAKLDLSDIPDKNRRSLFVGADGDP